MLACLRPLERLSPQEVQNDTLIPCHTIAIEIEILFKSRAFNSDIITSMQPQNPQVW